MFSAATSTGPTNAPAETLETLAHRCLATFSDADAIRRSPETHRFQEVLLIHLKRHTDLDRLTALSRDQLTIVADLVRLTRAMVIAASLDEPSGEQIARRVLALTHLYLRLPLVATS